MTGYTDYMRLALARALGISSHYIGKWELLAQSDAINTSRRTVGASHGARMQIELHPDTPHKAIRAMALRDSGAVHISQVSAAQDRPDQFGPPIVIDVALLYGKETQHIFKALLQNFTVRGKPHKRKPRK